MKLSGESHRGILPLQVGEFAPATGNFVHKHVRPIAAGILVTAVFANSVPALAATDTGPAGHALNPVTHSATKPNPRECSGTGHIFGKGKKQKIMNYFIICQGDSVAQAAGVVGNLVQESSLQTEEVESGGYSRDPSAAGSGGWGLAQWTPGSRAVSESRKYHIKGPIYTLQTQLALIAAEMRGQSPTGQHNMLMKLQLTSDPSHAAEKFEQYFEEGPIAAIGGGQLSNRQHYARQAAHEYGPAALRALRSHQAQRQAAA